MSIAELTVDRRRRTLIATAQFRRGHKLVTATSLLIVLHVHVFLERVTIFHQ